MANEFIGRDITSVEDVLLVDPVATVSNNSMDSGLAIFDFVYTLLTKEGNEILNKNHYIYITIIND